MVLCGLFLSALFKLVLSQQYIPQGGGEKEQQQKNVSCLSISLASPTQEREAWGHWEGRDESWDMRAGRDFRGHLVQHRISQIRKMRFREFNAQSHKDYMRPMTREQGLVHQRYLTNIGSLSSSDHFLSCIRVWCTHI